MFGELPKIFDKNFAIAYFLPVSLFIGASAGWLNLLGYWSPSFSPPTTQTIFDATFAAFVAWILSILLMVLNREIYRVLEGYGKWNPLCVFSRIQKKSFEDKKTRLEILNEYYNNGSFTDELRKERNKLMEDLAQKFPHEKELLLPTAFGNALRAFEVYPHVMYGLEGIYGWSRILAVVPRDYRGLIDDAKSQVDWWVNLGVMSFAFLWEVWIAIFQKVGFKTEWYITALNMFVPLTIFIVLNLIFQWRAARAAVGWGDYIKSAFDIYRFRLLELLDIDVPENREEERKMWMRYSQAIVFRVSDVLPELKESVRKRSEKIKSK